MSSFLSIKERIRGWSEWECVEDWGTGAELAPGYSSVTPLLYCCSDGMLLSVSSWQRHRMPGWRTKIKRDRRKRGGIVFNLACHLFLIAYSWLCSLFDHQKPRSTVTQWNAWTHTGLCAHREAHKHTQRTFLLVLWIFCTCLLTQLSETNSLCTAVLVHCQAVLWPHGGLQTHRQDLTLDRR